MMLAVPQSGLRSASPEAIADPLLAELYAHWAGLRPPAGTPLRADLDPVDIPKLLPYVALVECQDGGRRCRFRLVGTDVAFGSDPTGRYLDEAAPEGPYRDHICELYRLGAASAEGLYSEFSYGYTADSGPKLINRLFLPLIGPESAPEMMLVGQVRDKTEFTKYSAWEAAPGKIEPKALFMIDPSVSAQPTEQIRDTG